MRASTPPRRSSSSTPDNLIGRTGQPRDIANAMLWLASPAAAWVSGQIIKVHGGGSVVRLFGQ